MTKVIAAVAIVVLLAGCAPAGLGDIMVRTEGTPIPAPQKLDCDLIFPPASVLP